MKLLKDERIELNDGEVSIVMVPITTSQQSRLIELGAKKGFSPRIELTQWCLKNCVEKITVSGAEFKPRQLAEFADLSNHDTMAVMIKVGYMICNAAFPSGDDIKKSPPPPEPGA